MNTEILFEEYRGEVLECVHHGMVCIVDKDGIHTSIGNVEQICFYRSCSGKHLGLMLLARELGEPIENYWKQNSKTQVEILKVISMMSDIYQNAIVDEAKRYYSDVIVNKNKEEVGYRRAVFDL